MDLDAPPGNDKVKLLLQFFDDALADKAERSDVVGKDLETDGHKPSFLCHFSLPLIGRIISLPSGKDKIFMKSKVIFTAEYAEVKAMQGSQGFIS